MSAHFLVLGDPACWEGRAKLHPRPQQGDSWREECKGPARQAGCRAGGPAWSRSRPYMGTEAARLSRGPAFCQDSKDGHLSPRMSGTNWAPLHISGHLSPVLGEKDTLLSLPVKSLPFLPLRKGTQTHLGLPTAVGLRHLVGEVCLFKARSTHSLICGGV